MADRLPYRLGVIADVQYADVDDGTDFSGEEHRHFRNALNILKAAVDTWNSQGVDAVVQLGDAIDGLNKKHGKSEEALNTVLAEFQRCSTSLRFDLLGNHELYNFDREQLKTSGLNCAAGEGGVFYHSARLNDGWEAIFLDPYELALIGYPDGHGCLDKAKELMNANNPNVLDATRGDWFQGLSVDKHRYVPYNGAISEGQLKWLREVLASVQADSRHAIVFTHIPLLEGATKPKTVVWNGEEILAVVHEYHEVVVAVVAGHDHSGGYAVDAKGVHHVTMNSPLTAEPGQDCFAVIEFHDDWAHFLAYGRACVESGTSGKGREYKELIFKKGAENVAT